MDILPYIPESLTVHIGPADGFGENIVVSYMDYLKNVASSELYPTWEPNALIANIIAEGTFTLNRVYTEYYREQGYNFDITSDTSRDQSFVPGREIFSNISKLVDENFNKYLRRENSVSPLFAGYCNGTTSICDGLSQWGSQALALEGNSPLEILKYYYGDDIVLVENVPVQGITVSAPEINLKQGSISNDVRTLQIRLNRIAVNYPDIPKISKINGIFGLETENAVKSFQKIFNLTVDGIVGKQTWYEVQKVYYAVKKLNELVNEGLSYEEISKQLPESLSIGDKGELVSGLQYFLSFVSEYNNAVPSVEITGTYDVNTENSVKSFQKAYGLEETGIVDEKTYTVIYDVYIGIIKSLPDSAFAGTALPYPGYQLYYGITDEAVAVIQDYLNFISDTYTDIPKLTVDGVFGEQTQNAVSIFQDIQELYVNGVVGAVTWGAIADLYDDLKYGESVNEGQYPGYVLSEEESE